MTDMFAVCPNCGSPLLEQLLSDEDVWETEIGFADGDLAEARLYRSRWIKGDCWERVIGCGACGTEFDLEHAAASVTADTDAAWDEIAARAAGIDQDAFLVRAPTHVAHCQCGNRRFLVEFSRSRVFGALYFADEDDESDPRDRDLIATPEFEFENIYCPYCEAGLDIDDLEVEQVTTPVHPDQMPIGV